MSQELESQDYSSIIHAVLQKLPGADYFRNTSPENLRPQDYVVFRRSIAAKMPSAVAKEWNESMRRLKECNSIKHSQFAEASRKLTKKMVLTFARGQSFLFFNSFFNQFIFCSRN